MEITIRHLSGTHAGQEQNFPAGSITLGRNPSNQISFDPEKDRMVSGLHAEISPRDGGWVLRDLGSSNGTYINDEPVSERILRPGEVVQLGRNGPRLQVNFDAPVGAQAPEPPPAAGPPEGRTVMMMMNEPPRPGAGAAAGVAAPPYVAPAPRKKKGGMLRALLIVILLFGFLVVAGFAAIVFLRTRNPTPDQTASDSAATTTDTAATTTDVASTTTEETTTSSAIPLTTNLVEQGSTSPMSMTATGTGTDSLQQKINQEQNKLEQTKKDIETAKTTGATAVQFQDLERQLQASQRMIEDLQTQLQQRNDAYNKAIAEKDRQLQRAIRERNDAVRRLRDLQSKSQSRLEPPASTRHTRPVLVAGVLPASMLASMARLQDEAEQESAEAKPKAAAAKVPALVKKKQLKKRIAFVPEESEIPLPDMPEETPSELAYLAIQALGTTGRYVLSDEGGDALLAVTVTNYRNDVKTSVNTQGVTAGATAIAGIFGKSTPTSPVNTTSISMSSDMAARFRLLDPNQVELGQVEPSASSHDRKTSTDLGGLNIRQITDTDTALGDVTRKVTADAVDWLLTKLEPFEWTGHITDQDEKSVTIDCGARCLVEVGDYFQVMDGDEKYGVVKVKKVTPENAVAQIVSGEGDFAEKTVKYLGRTGDSPYTQKSLAKRAIQLRNDTEGHTGPGNTFDETKKLKAGARFDFLYSVGSWAKVSDGSSSFWIPLKMAQIIG